MTPEKYSAELPLILLPSRSCGSITDADVGLITREIAITVQTYVNAVCDAGGAPLIVPLPPIQYTAAQRTMFVRPYLELMRLGLAKGLLLCGGPDVSPELYGETNKHCGRLCDHMDQLDCELLRGAINYNVPVLGLCRGMQVINVELGGSCWQSMVPHVLAQHDLHGGERDQIAHHIQIEPSSLFSRILGGAREIEINSLHHQCLKRIGDGLRVVGSVPVQTGCKDRSADEASTVAATDDGEADPCVFAGDEVVEIIEHESRWIIGVQGHPEELFEFSTPWRTIFSAFIREASKVRHPSFFLEDGKIA